jgi:ABC-type Co2+ transport system permease subunit
VATRRTRVLVAVAVLGCVLVPTGVVLVAIGVSGHSDGRTVAGILLGLAGLACFRILYWTRRIRLMTQAGLAFHVDQDDTEGPGTTPR